MEDVTTLGFSSRRTDTWPSHQRAKAAAMAHEKTKVLEALRADAEAKEEEMNIDAYVQALSAHLKARAAAGDSFMLGEPRQLTCKRANGSFIRRSHIGGEEFAFDSIYVGKKGALIFVFKPSRAADYQAVEMFEKDAIECLSGFKVAMSDAMSIGALAKWANERNEAQREAELKAEREAVAAHAEHYKDFGAWA